MRVWLRDPSGAPQRATLAIDGVERASVVLTPSPDHDWTAAADLVLDRPEPDARFTVRAAGAERHGRLAPHPDAPGGVHVRLRKLPPAVWAARGRYPDAHADRHLPPDGRLLAARDARFLALIGDQIYSDGVEPIDVRDQMRKLPAACPRSRSARRTAGSTRGSFNVADFRRLLEAQPTLMAWDDHDIAEGWGR